MDPRKRAAASTLARGGSQAQAARAAGAARSTVLRWLERDDFKAAIEEFRANPEDESLTLESLIPLAHQQLKDSLTGAGTISASQAKIALDVLKAARAEEVATTNATGGTLAARLAELEGDGASD